MRKALALPGAVVALAAALIIGADSGDPPAARSSTVAEFASLASSGVNVDYTPLSSPADAVSTGDLIVEGTLVDVVDGIALTYPDPRYTRRRAGSYATLVVAVDKVLDGDAGKVHDGRVYVTVHKSRATRIARLAAANPRPQVVAVLDDITTWTPASGVRVTRPAAVPANAALHAPYSDGLWLQGPDDPEMSGLHADPDDLAAAWDRPRTVAQFAAAVERAAARP